MISSPPVLPESTELRDGPRSRGARRDPISAWRGLPLTAQLLAIGMLVSLAWFLAVRVAADRQEALARQRTTSLGELRRSEDAVERIGTALLTMSRAHRGFLLSGGEEFLDEVEGERISFDAAVATLLEDGTPAWVTREVGELQVALQAWLDSAYTPNARLRRARGLGAFDAGAPGAAGIVRGTVLMARAMAIQSGLRRALRADLQAIEDQVEAAQNADAWESLVIRMAALAIFLLLLTLILRLVRRALSQVVRAAEALEGGRYREARLPEVHRAPNRETAQLARTFGQLAASIEQRERQLQDDIEKLTELERLKRDFVSTVSHELRTPLTSVRGALGLILGGKVGEIPGRGRELLQIAMLNTERLIRLINDILDIEKIDAGHVAVRHDRLQLRPLLQTTVVGLESFAREHQVTLAVSTPAGTDAEVVGDADRLVQVLTNLVSNAVKYSPASAAVELSLTTDATSVTVRVRDHGPGISSEFAGRIFGRFQQASDPTLHRSGGTGLGLSIAKSIVELHAGTIGFEPAVGGGTSFWIRLPLAPAREVVSDTRRAILIVEDDPSMRDVLVAQFEAIARPIPVPSAEAALEVLEREVVVAIVLDPGLPGMDGLAFAQRIRQSEEHRRMPMFLYSAREYGAEELRAAGIRAADAFVKSRDAESILLDRMRHELLKQG